MMAAVAPKQIDIVEKIRMSYEIITKKQGGNKMMNSTTTGGAGGGVIGLTLTEDEYGEIDEDKGGCCDNVRQESVMKATKTGRGNGHQHHQNHKRMMKGSSIQVGEVVTMCGPIHQTSQIEFNTTFSQGFKQGAGPTTNK